MLGRSLTRVAVAGSRFHPLSAFRQTQPTATYTCRAFSSAPTIIYPPAAAFVGSPAPDFTSGAVINGEIQKLSLSSFHGKYTVLLFYPKDFTYVCPTELIAFNDSKDKFDKIGAQVIAISTDTEETHLAWIRTPRKTGGLGHMEIPVVADTTKVISAQYGVLKPEAGIALRGLFIIDPKGIIQQITINNFPVGRSVDETLRLISAFQYVAQHGEVCPADWKPGHKAMKAGPEDSQEYFSHTWGGVETNNHVSNPRIVRVTSVRHLEELRTNNSKLVVYFMAPWCGKCRQIAPYVDELASEFHDVAFAKIDTTEPALHEFAADSGARHLPAFAFYENSLKFPEMVFGYKKAELRKAITKLSGGNTFSG